MNRETTPEPAKFGLGLWRARLQSAARRVRSALPFLSGIVAAFVAILLYRAVFPGPAPLTTQQVNDSIASAMASATPPPPFSEGVYQIIQPSLILIQTKQTDKDGKEQSGLGSGVIINDNGDILTSLHVVANATEIKLTFADGSESSAQVAVKQPENDIAVLQAEQLPAQFVAATLGSPGRVGDEAYVVGHPLGLYGSMSAGIISGFDRTFQVPDSDVKLKGLIQIDAAVNPGNSGGPLLNRYGQVIGIVEGLVNPAGQDGFAGIGFAVPISVAGGAAGLPPD
jgi:S1-C subfamily serine protease